VFASVFYTGGHGGLLCRWPIQAVSQMCGWPMEKDYAQGQLY